MLRSTSIKKDSWKPVKLLARQPIDGTVIGLSGNRNGDIVSVLSDTNITIFNNRELVEKIPLTDGKEIHLVDFTNSLFVRTISSLICYDFWGKLNWKYDNLSKDSTFCISKNGSSIILANQNKIYYLNQFGEVEREASLSTPILEMSLSDEKHLIVCNEDGLFLVKEDDTFFKLSDKNDYSEIACSSEYLLAVSSSGIFAFSYSGAELWSNKENISNHIKFSNNGLKHIFIEDSNNIVCQDRNGSQIWTYNSREDLDISTVLESGEMTGISSNKVFHVLDSDGEQCWSYQAREKIINFIFSDNGGDVILASESKIHWFQNEGFLRIQIDAVLNNTDILFDKVSIYEKNLVKIAQDIQNSKSLKSGNFNFLKESFQLADGANQQLSSLHQRHVSYLDNLSSFMDKLGLMGAHTDEMIPLIYPYYSFHRDLHDKTNLDKSLKRAKNLLNKLKRFEIKSEKNSNTHNTLISLKESKKGISEEIINLSNLSKSYDNDVVSLESKVKELVMDWLRSGKLDSNPEDFLSIYHKSSNIRFSKMDLINDRIDNHIAFVDYSSEQKHLVLVSSTFSSKDKIDLNMVLKNNSSEKISDIFLRIKLDGPGISLSEPQSGVIRVNHLEAGETVSSIFQLNSVNRVFTRVRMVLQYSDSTGRKHTINLGDIETNFLGCYVDPLEIKPDEHDSLRLKYKDYTSHSSINIEGLSIKKITDISKNIPGLFLCNSKIDDTRSILYHSGKDNLDDSPYLSMIFVRTTGGEDSMRNVIELICHSQNSDKSSELKEEILSFIKNKLLESNGRLV